MCVIPLFCLNKQVIGWEDMFCIEVMNGIKLKKTYFETYDFCEKKNIFILEQ